MNTKLDLAGVGLVLEGGGFRGMYTAAVLDMFHRHGLFFDYAIGVSAGAAYGVSYVSRQYQRNLAVNPYVSDRRYCGLNHLIRSGNFFNWDFVYREMPTTLVPFDYDTFHKSTTKMKVVLTSCTTGEAVYKLIDGSTPERFRDLLTATSSLPLLSKTVKVDDDIYLDGGIADSIPVRKAFYDGNQRLIVVLTREKGYRKGPLKATRIFKLAYRRYPKMVEALISRSERYNQTLQELEALEAAGKIFVIRPAAALPISRIGNDPALLHAVYSKSLDEVEAIMPRLTSWLAAAE